MDNPGQRLVLDKLDFKLKDMIKEFDFFLDNSRYKWNSHIWKADDDSEISPLYGQSSWDTISGDDGDDVIFGGQGEDSLSGGAGEDTVLKDKHDGHDDHDGVDYKDDEIMELIHDRLFGSLASQIERFLMDVAATEGHVCASGDVLRVSHDGIAGTVLDLDAAYELDVDIDGPQAGVRAQPLLYSATINTASASLNLTAQWKVLDSAGAVIALGEGMDFLFTPRETGVYEVMWGVTDGDGGVGIAVTQVAIHVVLLIDDPSNSG